MTKYTVAKEMAAAHNEKHQILNCVEVRDVDKRYPEILIKQNLMSSVFGMFVLCSIIFMQGKSGFCFATCCVCLKYLLVFLQLN